MKPLGRPWRRFQHTPKRIGCKRADWIHVAQDRILSGKHGTGPICTKKSNHLPSQKASASQDEIWCTELIFRNRNVLKSLQNTVCLQMNGAVSKANKKFISHLTRAKRTSLAAATVQVSHALPAVRFSCLLRGRGVSLQDGSAAGKGFIITNLDT